MRRAPGELRAGPLDVCSELVEGRCVGFSASTDHDVGHGGVGEQPESDELAETSLETIALHRRVTVLRHDEPNAATAERGSDRPHVQMRRANSLPLSCDRLDIRAPGEPVAAKEAAAFLRRPRTCSGA